MKKIFGNPDAESERMVRSSIQTEEFFGRRGRTSWTDYDSSLDNYEISFFGVLPLAERGKEGLKAYIENFLLERKGKANGIDVGGPGSRLFEGFSPNFFANTIGVTLVDIRGQPVIAEDTGRNHLVLEADLADSRTPLKCKKLLHGEKADVIFERLMGGLPNLPQNPLDLAKILDSWYRLLNNKALMFAQYHPSWSNEISQLENRIESQFRGVLEFQTNDYFFRLARFPGAPETLPLPATN